MNATTTQEGTMQATYERRMTEVFDRQIAEDLALSAVGGYVEAGPRWVHVNPQGVVFTAFRGDTVAILQLAATKS